METYPTLKTKNREHKTIPYDPITKNYMPYKNGCFRHENCFTCKEDDCLASDSVVFEKPQNT